MFGNKYESDGKNFFGLLQILAVQFSSFSLEIWWFDIILSRYHNIGAAHVQLRKVNWSLKVFWMPGLWFVGLHAMSTTLQSINIIFPTLLFFEAKMKLPSIGFKKKVLAMLHILKYITQGSLPGLGKWTWWHERSVTKTQTWVDMSSKLVFLSPCLSSSHLVWSFLALFLCLLASSALWWLEVRMLWNFSACIYLWWAHWFFSKKYINYIS